MGWYPSIKLVLVGDNGVGKTSLCISHTTKIFPTDYIPTVFDGYAVSIPIGSETYMFGIFDTVGEGEYDHLRPLSYPQTDVFLVCFSVAMPASLENVQRKYFPELQHHCPGVPCIMVATHIDLRFDQELIAKMAKIGQRPLSTAQGERIAWQLGATKYLECSAKTQQGVQNVFDQGIAAAVTYINRKKTRNRKCVVL
ncbi:putative Rho small monomeric GTPase [Mycena haematopus]|nr:putative Rho small monomeric GTPase [Mycena haematopus]